MACLSSTEVTFRLFSPTIRLMGEEKLPSLSAVTIISSLSVMMAIAEFGLAEPLRVMEFSVITEFS